MVEFYPSLLNPKNLLSRSDGYSSSQINLHASFMNMKVLVLLFLISLIGSFNGFSQTTLINPATDGGFENGATFSANGWTAVNASTDGWQVGNAPVVATGSNCGYVSANGGTSWTYSQISTVTHIYKEVTVPVGENKINLSFKWKAGGEGSTTSDWDNLKVFWASSSYTPTTSAVTGQTQLIGSGAINGMYKLNSTNWNSETIVFVASPGTYRLIFSWKSDISDIANPPAALDDISLISSLPGNYTSIVTGDWSSPSTWDSGQVPTSLDEATIASGTVVTINANGQTAKNVTVNGTLVYGTTPSSFAVANNLIVNATGIISVFNGTTGKTLTVGGNLTNNGEVDLSVGATSAGNLTLNGANLQTISGSGVFVNDVIRNLTCSNTSTVIPNIDWQFNNISIEYNLNITNAKINLGSNKLTHGVSTTIHTGTGTFTHTNGGFMNGIFSRWWSAGATGYTTANPSSIPTGQAGRYPFYNASGQLRILYIGRTTPTVGGQYAVKYNDAGTITSGLSIVDGTYTVTDRWNGNFQVTTQGTTPDTDSYIVTIFAPDVYYVGTANSRVIGQNAAISGTNQATTAGAAAQRVGVEEADLLSPTGLYMGINSSDILFSSIVSGDWNNATTWNKGMVPSCTDPVIIGSGHTITVSSSGNVSKNVTVNNGGVLEVVSGDLTVGCTLNNNSLINNGTLTVSGGTLIINGNLMNNSGSTLNQSGGNIVVDGNDGTPVNSVATGTPLVRVTASAVANLNLTAGTLTIVDPHAGSSTTDYALSISQGGAANAASPNHTVKFGNGVSTTAGGHSNGFYVYLFPGSYYYSLGNVNVDVLTGTNRYLKTNSSIGILGDLTITSGEHLLASSTYVAGNIVNNGILTATSTLYLGTWTNATFSATTNAQTISGTGIYRNAATTPTAELTSLTINNNNAIGVTLNVPLSISGTLTMTSGLVNTTTANLLSLGTPTATGTLSGTPSATNMIKGPFVRTIGNSNTALVSFPVGKTDFMPIAIAPTTTAVSVFKAEAFDTNIGTANASINSLAPKRWEVATISGAFTDMDVKLTEAGIIETSIPVQGVTGSGEYTNAFGSEAIYNAGPPPTTESNFAVASADFTGFISYANSNVCMGTPTPGNTLASSTALCFGESVTLSLQNTTTGTGVTYIWESSTDGINFSPIDDATEMTYSVQLEEETYYRAQVTCEGSTGVSNFVHLVFANEITTTTPNAICGGGSATLEATANAEANVVWYSTAIGGAIIGIGSPFETPTINETTTFYAEAESTTEGNVSIGNATTLTGATAQPTAFCNRWPNYWSQTIYTAVELNQAGLRAGAINSLAYNIATLGDGASNTNFTVKIGTTSDTAFANSTFLSNSSYTTVYGPATYTHTASGWQTITFTTPFIWDGVSNIVINVTHDGADSINNSQTYYTATTDNKVLWVKDFSGSTTSGTTSQNRLNIQLNGQLACTSPRVAVLATVTTPPDFVISANSMAICNGDTTETVVTITTGASDYDTYEWSPAEGVTGDEVSGWFFNPTVTTTYTLTASQSSGALCNAVSMVEVMVNSLPIVPTFPDSIEICVGSTTELIAGVDSGTNLTIGTGTTSLGATTYPNPLSAWYGGVKTQMIYTVEELIELGLNSGAEITSVGLNITNFVNSACTDLTIRMKQTNSTTLSGFESGTQTVYGPSTFTPSANGIANFSLTTPFIWNGTDNIIVEFVHNAGNSGNGSGTRVTYTTTPNAMTFYGAKDSTPGGIAGFDALTSYSNTGSTTNRPNLVLTFSNSIEVVWTPITNLYIDEAATIPYVADTPALKVYVKSETEIAATNYIATITNTNSSCFNNATAVVTINALPNLVITNPATTCGTNVDVTAAEIVSGSDVGLTYTYWADPLATITLPSPEVITSSGTYYIKATNASDCSVIMAVEVNINTLPNLVITNPVAACGTTVDITAAAVVAGSDTGLTYSYWADPFATVTFPSPDAIVSSGTFYIKATNANDCSVIMPVVVTVNNTDAPTGTATQDFTTGETLANFTVEGENITWYTDATGSTVLLSSTLLVSGTTYYASQTLNGCESTDRLAITAGVNLKAPSFTIDSLRYYPNPVQDILSIDYTEEIQGVQLYNMLGQLVYNRNTNAMRVTIDMASMAAGNYILQVTVNGITKNVKVIKK